MMVFRYLAPIVYCENALGDGRGDFGDQVWSEERETP
jgi:hypothetical protein